MHQGLLPFIPYLIAFLGTMKSLAYVQPHPSPDKEKTERGRKRTFVGGRVRLHVGFENLFGIK